MTAERAIDIASELASFIADRFDCDTLYHLFDVMGLEQSEIDALGYGDDDEDEDED